MMLSSVFIGLGIQVSVYKLYVFYVVSFTRLKAPINVSTKLPSDKFSSLSNIKLRYNPSAHITSFTVFVAECQIPSSTHVASSWYVHSKGRYHFLPLSDSRYSSLGQWQLQQTFPNQKRCPSFLPARH